MNMKYLPAAILLTCLAIPDMASASLVTLSDSEDIALNADGALSFNVYEAATGGGTAALSSFTGNTSASQAFNLALGKLNLPSGASINSAVLKLTASIGDSILNVSDPLVSNVRNQRTWQIVGFGCGYWGTPCWDVWGWGDSATPGVGGNASFGLTPSASFNSSTSAAIGSALPSGGGNYNLVSALLSGSDEIDIAGQVSALLTSSIADYGYFATTSYSVSGTVPFRISAELVVDYTAANNNTIPEPVSAILVLTGLGGMALLPRKH